VSTLASIEDLDRAALLKTSEAVIQGDKQCRIMLAKDFAAHRPESQRFVALEWHDGRKPSLIKLLPGKSVVQPLYKAQVWFGPFALPIEYAAAETERERNFLRDKYFAEKTRVLNRYDYERPTSKGKDGYEPIGPHRFPDVSVTIIESDGTEGETMRLHEVYKIGAFDEAYPLDSFGVKINPDDLKARYEHELKEQALRHERETAEVRREMSELKGLLQGVLVANAPAGK